MKHCVKLAIFKTSNYLKLFANYMTPDLKGLITNNFLSKVFMFVISQSTPSLETQSLVNYDI